MRTSAPYLTSNNYTELNNYTINHIQPNALEKHPNQEDIEQPIPILGQMAPQQAHFIKKYLKILPLSS